MASLNAFAETNYTISAEIELYSPNGPLQSIQNRIDELKSAKDNGAMSRFQTSGIFYAPGDFVMPISEKFFDPANYSLPEDLQVNGSVYVYQDNKAPKLLDSLVGNSSVDGHDHRSDFSWILSTGFDWIITDTPDEWDSRLQSQGRRNIKYMIADGKEEPDQKLASGWYRRRHARDITP
ncbi:hypothetical protein RBB50_012181 [Rhinocladiella similis]